MPRRQRTRSSRCTISRSYRRRARRARSCVERPSSSGSSSRIVVHQAAGHQRSATSTRSTGSPAMNVPDTPSRRPAAATFACDDGRTAPSSGRGRRGPRWRARARAAGWGDGGRWGGTACRPARPARAPRPLCGRGEHDGDAGGGRDAGGLDLGAHAAGADAGGPGRAEGDRGQVGLAVHQLDQPGPRTGRAGRRRGRRRRRAAPAGRRGPGARRARRAGRCRRSRISLVATVSFSLTTGTTPSSSSRANVRCALR